MQQEALQNDALSPKNASEKVGFTPLRSCFVILLPSQKWVIKQMDALSLHIYSQSILKH